MTDEQPSDNINHDSSRLIAERRAKLGRLREAGSAYPNDFRFNALASKLHVKYDALEKEEIVAGGEIVMLSGRMMAKRVMGKASFARLQDRSGDIQLYIQPDALPDGVYEAFKTWDVGDILGCQGSLFKTGKGELTIRVSSLRILSKSLRPLPEKFHGLTDQETRYRQRYVDLIVNSQSRDVFHKRSRVISYIRRFMEAPERDFLEVETPMMHIIPGGATARPFTTHHNALDIDLYLRVAPELYLKRLVVGGFERVYEINRNFRNEGVSTRHNPEFTMLEFYQAYADFHDLMDLTEDMLRGLADEICGGQTIEYQGKTVDFSRPFARLSVCDAIAKYNDDISVDDLKDMARTRAHADRLGVHSEESFGLGRLHMEIFDASVEKHLHNPTFITAYPTEVSPLARRNDEDPTVTDRFELFITGRELANGFSELNDPEDQAQRFLAQVVEKDAGDQEAMHYDADYIRALEYGMPPTAGEGIGIDRLVMLLTDSASIRDVLLFPYMRPEVE